MPTSAKKHCSLLRRFQSLLLALVFIFTNSLNAYALVSPEKGTGREVLPVPFSVSALQVPVSLGKIEEVYQARGQETGGKGQENLRAPRLVPPAPFVILIQDAHAIPAAQRNIQKLIEHFQKEYGVGLVALEGAASELDPQIFNSFPNKAILKKTLDEYLEKGELTGSTAASISSENTARYHGIENWELYEEGVELYLKALEKEPELLEKLQASSRKLQAEKIKIYSKELLEVDKTVEAFKRNDADLMAVVKKLKHAADKGTGREVLPASPAGGPVPLSIQALLEEIEKEGKDQSAVEREVREIAEEIRKHMLQATGRRLQGDRNPEAWSLQLAAQKVSDTFSTVSVSDTAAFNQKYQDFQTSRITPEAFALFLKELVETVGVAPRGRPLIRGRLQESGQARFDRFTVPSGVEGQGPAPTIEISDRLNHLIKNHKHLRDIRGTQFFRDFETFVRSVKESLFRNDEEQRLDAESRKLDLLEKLAKLELSRGEWEEIKAVKRQALSVKRDFIHHIAFYTNAESRESVFLTNLEKLMAEHASRDTLHTSLLIAGGFHTEGLARQFKEKGISYVIVRPEIGSIPEKSLYRQHMRGEVSWKKYFEVEKGSEAAPGGGKVNLYKAFVRGARDKLLREALSVKSETKEDIESTTDASRDTLHTSRLLKSWRDEILRDLAQKEQLTKAHEYTQFLDEISTFHHSPLTNRHSHNASHFTLHDSLARIDHFIQGLRYLNTHKKLTEQNIIGLLGRANIPDTTGAVLAPRSEIRADLLGLGPVRPPRIKGRGKPNASEALGKNLGMLTGRLPAAQGSQEPARSELRPSSNELGQQYDFRTGRSEVPSARSELRTAQAVRLSASRSELRSALVNEAFQRLKSIRLDEIRDGNLLGAVEDAIREGFGGEPAQKAEGRRLKDYIADMEDGDAIIQASDLPPPVETEFGRIDLSYLNDVSKYEGYDASAQLARDLHIAHLLGMVTIARFTGISPSTLTYQLLRKKKIKVKNIGTTWPDWALLKGRFERAVREGKIHGYAGDDGQVRFYKEVFEEKSPAKHAGNLYSAIASVVAKAPGLGWQVMNLNLSDVVKLREDLSERLKDAGWIEEHKGDDQQLEYYLEVFGDEASLKHAGNLYSAIASVVAKAPGLGWQKMGLNLSDVVKLREDLSQNITDAGWVEGHKGDDQQLEYYLEVFGDKASLKHAGALYSAIASLVVKAPGLGWQKMDLNLSDVVKLREDLSQNITDAGWVESHKGDDKQLEYYLEVFGDKASLKHAGNLYSAIASVVAKAPGLGWQKMGLNLSDVVKLREDLSQNITDAGWVESHKGDDKQLEYYLEVFGDKASLKHAGTLYSAIASLVVKAPGLGWQKMDLNLSDVVKLREDLSERLKDAGWVESHKGDDKQLEYYLEVFGDKASLKHAGALYSAIASLVVKAPGLGWQRMNLNLSDVVKLREDLSQNITDAGWVESHKGDDKQLEYYLEVFGDETPAKHAGNLYSAIASVVAKAPGLGWQRMGLNLSDVVKLREDLSERLTDAGWIESHKGDDKQLEYYLEVFGDEASLKHAGNLYSAIASVVAKAPGLGWQRMGLNLSDVVKLREDFSQKIANAEWIKAHQGDDQQLEYYLEVFGDKASLKHAGALYSAIASVVAKAPGLGWQKMDLNLSDVVKLREDLSQNITDAGWVESHKGDDQQLEYYLEVFGEEAKTKHARHLYSAISTLLDQSVAFGDKMQTVREILNWKMIKQPMAEALASRSGRDARDRGTPLGHDGLRSELPSARSELRTAQDVRLSAARSELRAARALTPEQKVNLIMELDNGLEDVLSGHQEPILSTKQLRQVIRIKSNGTISLFEVTDDSGIKKEKRLQIADSDYPLVSELMKRPDIRIDAIDLEYGEKAKNTRYDEQVVDMRKLLIDFFIREASGSKEHTALLAESERYQLMGISKSARPPWQHRFVLKRTARKIDLSHVRDVQEAIAYLKRYAVSDRTIEANPWVADIWERVNDYTQERDHASPTLLRLAQYLKNGRLSQKHRDEIQHAIDLLENPAYAKADRYDRRKAERDVKDVIAFIRKHLWLNPEKILFNDNLQLFKAFKNTRNYLAGQKVVGPLAEVERRMQQNIFNKHKAEDRTRLETIFELLLGIDADSAKLVFHDALERAMLLYQNRPKHALLPHNMFPTTFSMIFHRNGMLQIVRSSHPNQSYVEVVSEDLARLLAHPALNIHALTIQFDGIVKVDSEFLDYFESVLAEYLFVWATQDVTPLKSMSGIIDSSFQFLEDTDKYQAPDLAPSTHTLTLARSEMRPKLLKLPPQALGFASREGQKHVESGKGNQDSGFYTTLPSGIIIAGVFDGYGQVLETSQKISGLVKAQLMGSIPQATEDVNAILNPMKDALARAHKKVRNEFPDRLGGTTALAAAIYPYVDGTADIFLIYGGDSRASLLDSAGQISHLTIDNLVPESDENSLLTLTPTQIASALKGKDQELFATVATQQDLDNHPRRSYILRQQKSKSFVFNTLSLSKTFPYRAVATVAKDVPAGWNLLLASDGIHKNLADQVILEEIQKAKTMDAQSKAQALVDATYDIAAGERPEFSWRASSDDATALVIDSTQRSEVRPSSNELGPQYDFRTGRSVPRGIVERTSPGDGPEEPRRAEVRMIESVELGSLHLGDHRFRIFKDIEPSIKRIRWEWEKGDQKKHKKEKKHVPELFAYSVDDKLRGTWIDPAFRKNGTLRMLLNSFFEAFPEVEETHPLMENLAVLHLLTKGYGFEPKFSSRIEPENRKFEIERFGSEFYEVTVKSETPRWYMTRNGMSDELKGRPLEIPLFKAHPRKFQEALSYQKSDLREAFLSKMTEERILSSISKQIEMQKWPSYPIKRILISEPDPAVGHTTHMAVTTLVKPSSKRKTDIINPVIIENRAEDLIKELETHKFDLIFASQGMPGLTGTELVSLIRKTNRHILTPKDIPMVVLSGNLHDIVLTDKQLKEMGNVLFLQRPFELKDLQQIIDLGPVLKRSEVRPEFSDKRSSPIWGSGTPFGTGRSELRSLLPEGWIYREPLEADIQAMREFFTHAFERPQPAQTFFERSWNRFRRILLDDTGRFAGAYDVLWKDQPARYRGEKLKTAVAKGFFGIDPKYSNQGYAAQFFTHIKQDWRRMGFDLLIGDSITENALGFWTKQGGKSESFELIDNDRMILQEPQYRNARGTDTYHRLIFDLREKETLLPETFVRAEIRTMGEEVKLEQVQKVHRAGSRLRDFVKHFPEPAVHQSGFVRLMAAGTANHIAWLPRNEAHLQEKNLDPEYFREGLLRSVRQMNVSARMLDEFLADSSGAFKPSRELKEEMDALGEGGISGVAYGLSRFRNDHPQEWQQLVTEHRDWLVEFRDAFIGAKIEFETVLDEIILRSGRDTRDRGTTLGHDGLRSEVRADSEEIKSAFKRLMSAIGPSFPSAGKPLAEAREMIEKENLGGVGPKIEEALIENLAKVITSASENQYVGNNAKQIITYIEFRGVKQLRSELRKVVKETLQRRKVLNRNTGSLISDKVWREESEALVQTLGSDSASKTLDKAGTVALVLSENLGESLAANFVKGIERSNLDTVALIGKGQAAADLTSRLKPFDINVRPLSNLRRSLGKDEPGAIPTGIFDREFRSQINKTFLPFWIEQGNVGNPLVKDYVEELQIVALFHTVQILQTNPELLKDRSGLRAELLKRLALFEGFNSIVSVGEWQGQPGFAISSAAAQAYLEYRSQLRIRQAA